MRLPLLTLALGLVAGFALHSLVTTHPNWYRSLIIPTKTPASVTDAPSAVQAGPRIYPEPEKILARLLTMFDKAVVVVLADESYDGNHKRMRVAVLEVWKGPQHLVGKTMDSPLSTPMPSSHSKDAERVLRFIYMTPSVGSGSSVFIERDALRMNPAITVNSLKESLLAHGLAQK